MVGGGLHGLHPLPYLKKKEVVSRVTVVIYLVVTSSNSAWFVCVEWCCCLNKAQFSQDYLAARGRDNAFITTSGSLRSHDPERV